MRKDDNLMFPETKEELKMAEKLIFGQHDLQVDKMRQIKKENWAFFVDGFRNMVHKEVEDFTFSNGKSYKDIADGELSTLSKDEVDKFCYLLLKEFYGCHLMFFEYIHKSRYSYETFDKDIYDERLNEVAKLGDRDLTKRYIYYKEYDIKNAGLATEELYSGSKLINYFERALQLLQILRRFYPIICDFDCSKMSPGFLVRAMIADLIFKSVYEWAGGSYKYVSLNATNFSGSYKKAHKHVITREGYHWTVFDLHECDGYDFEFENFGMGNFIADVSDLGEIINSYSFAFTEKKGKAKSEESWLLCSSERFFPFSGRGIREASNSYNVLFVPDKLRHVFNTQVPIGEPEDFEELYLFRLFTELCARSIKEYNEKHTITELVNDFGIPLNLESNEMLVMSNKYQFSDIYNGIGNVYVGESPFKGLYDRLVPSETVYNSRIIQVLEDELKKRNLLEKVQKKYNLPKETYFTYECDNPNDIVSTFIDYLYSPKTANTSFHELGKIYQNIKHVKMTREEETKANKMAEEIRDAMGIN